MYSQVNPRQSFPEFDIWNEEKKKIHLLDSSKKKYINPGEVWYVKLGINIGFEQNGKQEFRRPVLIIKQIGNMFFCIPLTTKGKDNSFYIKIKQDGLENSYLSVSQGKVLDKRRFLDHIGTIGKYEMSTIKKLLKEIYF